MTTGDAYLFDRLGGFSGGVSLDEPLLPASSLTRNTRNMCFSDERGVMRGDVSCFLSDRHSLQAERRCKEQLPRVTRLGGDNRPKQERAPLNQAELPFLR